MRVCGTGIGTVVLCLSGLAWGHGSVDSGPATARMIEFPDTAEYRTLVVDLHTHSVFSDGHVWPTIRVQEAVRDGLDGLAITEHLEYQPHITDIPHRDRNRSFEEASRAASGLEMVVIPGVEITRLGDPGHMNAVFVQDANPLVEQRLEHARAAEHMFETRAEAEAFAGRSSEQFRGAHRVDHDGETVWMPYADQATYFALTNFAHASTRAARDVVEAANAQGAFVFWNHPDFASVDAGLNDFHAAAVADGLLHGIEIANGDRYYQNAHRLALEHDLALIGVSDVHELIDWDYRPEAAENPGHRPVTLVFAAQATAGGIRDALFARRTVVWWKDTLIGRPADLQPLLRAMVRVAAVEVTARGVRVTLTNESDAPLLLRNESGFKLLQHSGLVELPPHGNVELNFAMDEPRRNVTLEFLVLNALTAPDVPATLALALDGEI